MSFFSSSDNQWDRSPKPDRPFGTPPKDDFFTLGAPIGPDQPNRREDLIKVETILGNSGDFDLPRRGGPTGFWGPDHEGAVKAFQTREGLKVDGLLNPGGPTITAMKSRLGGLLSAFTPPTPSEVDDHHADRDNGGPGLLNLRPPRVTIRRDGPVPELDEETLAFNRASAGAIAGSSQDGDIPAFRARTVAQLGQTGIDAAHDMLDQVAVRSGRDRADRLAHAILSNLPAGQQRAFLGGELPPGRPLGVKLAALADDGERPLFQTTEAEAPKTESPPPDQPKAEPPPAPEPPKAEPPPIPQPPEPLEQQQAAQSDNGKIDVDKVAEAINNKAKPGPTQKCATHVREALAAGGVDTRGHPQDAKDYGPTLEKNNFKPVDNKDYVPQKGDVVVIQPYEGGNPSGHIAIFNGKEWVSDTKQRDMWGGQGYRAHQPPHVVYRRRD